MLRVAALLAVAIAFAGCGSGKSGNAQGGESESAQVVSVTRRYFAALANGNGSEACSLLTGEAKRRLLLGGAALSLLTHRGNPLTCPDEIKLVHELLGSDEIAEFSNARVMVVSLSGNTATARATVGSRTTDVPLTKTAAGWLINKVAAQTTPRPAQPAPFAPESLEAFENQLAAGQVKAAIFNKRIRTVHLTLGDGRHVLVQYAAHEEPKVAAAIAAKGVPVTIMTRVEAERDAATARAGSR
jgi:hypothetical protein